MTFNEYNSKIWTLKSLMEFADEHRLMDYYPMNMVFIPCNYDVEIENTIKEMLDYTNWREIRRYLNYLDIDGYDVIIDDGDGPYGLNFGQEDIDFLDELIDGVRQVCLECEVFDEDNGSNDDDIMYVSYENDGIEYSETQIKENARLVSELYGEG